MYFNNFMKGIFVIRGTLTFFGSLGGDIDIIGSLGRTLTMRWYFEGVICIFLYYLKRSLKLIIYVIFT